MDDYKSYNRRLWDARTECHFKSDFYNVAGFLKGASSLNPIETELFGDITHKSLLHLQCHFGLDTLSLARLGARVCGVDLSGVAIDQARILTDSVGLDARFIQSDVYELPGLLDEKFDIVFTSYGVLGWLPDMQRWAETVKHFLKPGGMLILVEFHPMAWVFGPGFKTIDYSYFNREAIIEHESGSYADSRQKTGGTSVCWNHSLSDVLGGLLGQQLRIAHFSEYDYSPYNCFDDMIATEDAHFQIRSLAGKLPLLYALKAINEV